jgi:hypothetical protein
MADLADELLATALRFSVARLQALSALNSPDELADAFAIPHAATAAAAVAAHLNDARTEIGLAQQSLLAPDVNGAATHLSAALNDADAALTGVAWPGGNPGLAGLINLVRNQAIASSGLLRQIGLDALPATPAGITVENGALVYRLARNTPTNLSAGVAQLTLTSTALTARLRLTNAALPLLSVSLEIDNADATVGDAVVRALLGGGGAVEATLVIAVDTTHGLTVGGGAATRVTLPASAKVGALDIQELSIDIPSSPANTIDVGATVTAALGPMTILVTDAGVRLTIDPGGVSNGASPIAIAPKPPDGMGLSLATGLLNGGGFLEQQGNTFGGALDLTLGPVEVKAVGLLTIGGDTGFAIVIVMSVEFFPAIDLSFGFTLNAVGGVVGVQHVVAVDALGDAFLSHALDYLLFPDDPVAAAPTILNTLQTVFPLQKGGFVVGPMIKLGWGRPVSFATATLGVILSLPDPTVVILGRLHITVPAPELPIVNITADVLGEFSSDMVLVLVSLVDSQIAGYAVSGDFGVLLRFGSSPEIAFSAGGFHPRFQPPPELAKLRRVTVDMSPPAVLTMRAEAYLALTTNTFQLGTHIELGADLGPIGAHGFLDFDALVHFQPQFTFEIDLGAGVAIEFAGDTIAGVTLHLHLEGPAPWIAHGTGTFTFIVSKDFEVGPLQWGDANNPPPAIVHPRDLIAKAIGDPAAWQTALPPNSDHLAHLRADPAPPPLLVHPLGLFEVRQHVAPLETEIVRIGANPAAAGETYVHFGLPQVNKVDVGAISEVTDLFSAGQFLDLTDDQKLSRPSFEPMQAGARINPPAGAGFDLARLRQSDLEYETFVPDDEGLLGRRVRESAATFLANARGITLSAGAAGRTRLREAARYDRPPMPITMSDPAQTVIRGKSDLAPNAVVTNAALGYTHAATALADALVAHPELHGQLQLVRVGVAP